MEINGLNGLDHSERILRVEATTTQLVAQVAAQGAQLNSLEKVVETGQKNILDKLEDVSSHISEKLGDLSEHLEKTVDKEDKNEKRLNEIEVKAKISGKIKTWVWGTVGAILTGSLSLVIEHYINHAGK